MSLAEIDGSLLEGGGQVLRVSAALSAVTGIPLRVFNIRAKRLQLGLRMQHITGIRSLAELTDAEVQGLAVGSSEVRFTPRSIKAGVYHFDIGTAGSTTLTLQALMPAAVYAATEISVEIRGGTNAKWSPPVDYLQHVLFPTLEKAGVHVSITLTRRGFYPKGSGIIKAKLQPINYIKPLRITGSSEVRLIYGLSYSCRLPSHVARRMAESAKHTLEEAGYKSIQVDLQSLQSGDTACAISPGCGIILVAELANGAKLAADRLGEPGKPAESVGSEGALDLAKTLKTNASVDRYLADQLIIWMSLAEGISEIQTNEFTLHAATAIEVCRRLLAVEFSVDGELGQPAVISCKGEGLKSRFTPVASRGDI